MALMPLKLALVAKGGIHSMYVIGAPYLGSGCQRWPSLMPVMLALVVRGGIHSMKGIDAAPYVGSSGEMVTSFHE